MNKEDFALLYMFLALNGRVTVRGHNMFVEIMKHEGFDKHDAKEIGRNTMKILSNIFNDKDREKIVRHQFEKNIRNNTKKGNTIHNRTVLWTLINLGFSDSKYSKPEQRLVHLYAKKIGIDKSYVLEMEDVARTFFAITQEKEFLSKIRGQDSDDVLDELEENQQTLQRQVSTLVSIG